MPKKKRIEGMNEKRKADGNSRDRGRRSEVIEEEKGAKRGGGIHGNDISIFILWLLFCSIHGIIGVYTATINGGDRFRLGGGVDTVKKGGRTKTFASRL